MVSGSEAIVFVNLLRAILRFALTFAVWMPRLNLPEEISNLSSKDCLDPSYTGLKFVVD